MRFEWKGKLGLAENQIKLMLSSISYQNQVWGKKEIHIFRPDTSNSLQFIEHSQNIEGGSYERERN